MGGRFAFNRRLGAAFCRPGSEDGGRVSLGDSGVLYTGKKEPPRCFGRWATEAVAQTVCTRAAILEV